MNATRYAGTAIAASRRASDGVPMRSCRRSISSVTRSTRPSSRATSPTRSSRCLDSFGDLRASFGEVVDLALQFGDVGRAHRQPDRQHGEEDEDDRQRPWQARGRADFTSGVSRRAAMTEAIAHPSTTRRGDEHVAARRRRAGRRPPCRSSAATSRRRRSLRRRLGVPGRSQRRAESDAASSAIAVLYRGVPDRRVAYVRADATAMFDGRRRRAAGTRRARSRPHGGVGAHAAAARCVVRPGARPGRGHPARAAEVQPGGRHAA